MTWCEVVTYVRTYVHTCIHTYIHLQTYIHNIIHFIDPKFSKKNEKYAELVHLQLLEIFYLK